jgi:hypothetical protein
MTDFDRTTPPDTRHESTAALIGRLVESIPDLFRKEGLLFRAEMDEKVSQATTAVGIIVGGTVIALTALNVLAAALTAAIAEAGISPAWSAVIVGGVLALIALAMIGKGTRDLKASRLAPNRTARSLGRDAAVAKEATR